jgi:hypothetical protein
MQSARIRATMNASPKRSEKSEMKALFALTFTLALTGAARGTPVDRVILAAMKLAEEPNYSWTTTVVDDARTYDIDGKTERNGITWERLPMVKPIALRLGRDADTQIEAIFKGNACAIHTPTGWKAFDELPKVSPDWMDYDDSWRMAPAGSSGGLWGQLGNVDPDPFSSLLPFAPPAPDDDEEKPYSNAQFAAYRPHDDVAILVSSFADLAVDGDDAIGRLTDVGARLLLAHDGVPRVTPISAAGVFKMSFRDGKLAKFTVRLEGVVSVDRRRVIVHQISTTEITHVGTTQVLLSDDARRKVDGSCGADAH